MKRAQSLVEYIIAILLFVIIVMYLLFAYFDRLPEEISSTRELELCSEAESAALAFLDFPGDPSTWESAGSLRRLGLASSDSSSAGVNYSKWQAMTTRGYYNISTAIALNRSFNLAYNIYAFNLTTDPVPQYPNDSSPKVFIVRSSDAINISAGSADTLSKLKLTLFFPYANPVISNCPAGALEAGEALGIKNTSGGAEVSLNWTFSSGDHDCASISSINASSLIYILAVNQIGLDTGKTYPLYFGNHTDVYSTFGSTEHLLSKPLCGVSRRRIIYSNSEAFPAEINLKVW